MEWSKKVYREWFRKRRRERVGKKKVRKKRA